MIVVTGANGFIGSNLVKKLQFMGETVLPVDTSNMYDLFLAKNISKIYHLGAISNTTERSVEKLYEYNVKYSIDLFLKNKNIPIVYASSGSVYGNSKNHIINPLNQYAMSKAMVDYWVKDHISLFNNIVGLRFFNVYGENEYNKGDQASPIYKFSKQAQNRKVIEIFEDSHKTFRDFVCIDDVINCMFYEKPSGIYDVGTSQPISFKQVADMIAKKYDAKVTVIPFPDHLKGKYQSDTCADENFDHKFKSVSEFVFSI